MMSLRWLIVAAALTAAVILVAAAMRRQGWLATGLQGSEEFRPTPDLVPATV